MTEIFGIDLGTTNSEIARVKADGTAEVFIIDNDLKYLPSVVGVDANGTLITGIKARNQYAAFPENTVLAIKRKMGSGETISLGANQYTPAGISAEILKALKAAAERHPGVTVRQVVITVPAYFTDLQRNETLKAGEMAGLEVVRIINEPTAAALAYGGSGHGKERILVYDLGGGTFDISLIEMEDGVIEVLATDGNTHLGGDDFDQLLVDALVAGLPAASVPADDLRIRARLRNVAERVKIELSTKTVVDVREEFVAMHAGKPVHLEQQITRQHYEDLIGPLLDQTFALLDNVLDAARLKPKDIDKVLLVGGASYTPLVADTLRARGFNVHRSVDPTYCVAMGAALQGAIITGTYTDKILIDVNSHSLGIRAIDHTAGVKNDNYFSVIIHRNTPIPTEMTQTYHTVVKNQQVITIDAYQGEDPIATKNTFIGSFTMDKLPKRLPEGSEVDVTFEYNLNGVVEVMATERKSGTQQKMQVDIHRLQKIEPPGGASFD
jgi:molecular chaperone DnaK